MTRSRQSDSKAGFSLVELLVVVAIIMILATIAIPAIGRYIRNYRIRAATQQVASELQSARAKAIARNANLGVVFIVASNRTYRWVIEDDTQPPIGWTTVAGENLTTLIADPAQAGPLRTLPPDVQFDAPNNCPGGAAATDWGLRFTRLGRACKFGDAGCGATPGTPPTLTSYINIGSNGAMFCLREVPTNLRRQIAVSLGGRVLPQP